MLGLLAATAPAHADGPLLVIDRWWGVDYAKTLATYWRSNPPVRARRPAIRKAWRVTTVLN
jgi:hypothetical protein